MQECTDTLAAEDDAVVFLLTARTVLYRVLARAFGGEPDEEMLSWCASDVVGAAVEALVDDGADRDDGSHSLAQRLAGAADAADSQLECVRGQYTRLFIGPGKLSSPPWESVHVGADALLFQASTLAVRQAYRAAGFQSAGYPHEPDDHLGAELSFMAALSSRALECYQRGDGDAAACALEAQQSFLNEHLLRWIGSFRSHLCEASAAPASDTLYPVLAELAEMTCTRDASLVDELLAALRTCE